MGLQLSGIFFSLHVNCSAPGNVSTLGVLSAFNDVNTNYT